MKKKPKSSKIEWRKEKIPKLEEMRKENLINHELLKETAE